MIYTAARGIRGAPGVPRSIVSIFLGAVLFAGAPTLVAEVEPGDTNADDNVDISDAIRLLNWLSSGTVSEICLNAADVNGDGRVDISDAVYILNYMFSGGSGLQPFPPELERTCIGPQGPMRLLDVQAIPLTPTSAAIAWRTTQLGDTRVRFGLDETLAEEAYVHDGLHLTHFAPLTGLRPNRTYYYAASSRAVAGNLVEAEIGSFTTLPMEEPYEVRGDHPRLFLDGEDLREIRRRVEGSGYHAERWESLVRFCEGNLGTPRAEILSGVNYLLYVRAFAFAGLVSREERFESRAIELALALAENRDEDSTRDTTEAMALVYDWLHGRMGDEVRTTLRQAIVAGCLRLEDLLRGGEFLVNGHSIRNHRPLLLGALAVHGENGSAPRWIDTVRHRLHHGYLATHRFFAGTNGGSAEGWSYLNYNIQYVLACLATWKSATGQDWFATERDWLEGELAWYIYGLRGDGNFFLQGDAQVYDWLIHEHRIFALHVARAFRNPQAQWYANIAREQGEFWAPHAVSDILWSEPAIPAAPPEWPPSRLFRNAGTAVLRESWNRGAAMASFRCEQVYSVGHTHRDNCSFTIYYKGDLALDSGLYDDYGGSHHRNYTSRTIAHNTITIHDPEEEFSLYGRKFANDGGQRWLQSGKDVPSWFPPHIDDALLHENGYLAGGIIRFEDKDPYTYLVGDGTPSYSPAKLRKFYRHFLWLKEVSAWSRPVIVVFDDVIGRNRLHKKTYHLHTQNEPRIDDRLVTAENGRGKLYQWTVLPEDAVLEAVGGPGREFTVDGVNYPPSREPRGKEEAGAWRIEVSPAVQNRSDFFLHALYPVDAGAPRPPRPVSFSAGNMMGCLLDEWTILFPTGEALAELYYDSGRFESKHLLVGMVPLSAYDLWVDDFFQETLYSSTEGTLFFRLGRPGAVRLARRTL